ncbi:MAG: hypothetical protein AAB582_00920 [Patescibacteria group bacterium]
MAQSNDGNNRRIDIHNHTGSTIWEFYASTTNQTSWQEDILDDDVIVSGDTQLVNLDDGTGRCLYDVKVVFKGGGERTRNRVNVCTTSVIDVYPDGIYLK